VRTKLYGALLLLGNIRVAEVDKDALNPGLLALYGKGDFI
jgi:hypothetical protein